MTSAFPRRSAAAARPSWWLAAAAALALGGCANLPRSGPTAHEIETAHTRFANFDLVNVDDAVIASLGASPSTGRGRLAALAQPGDVDTIGAGDLLQVTVYEVGATLFARASMADSFAPPSGTGENLPPVMVERDGMISLPWIGRIMAAGKTAEALGAELSRAYRGKSENPQVMVAIRENVSNTVVVQGDVKKPGRLPLTLARERLLDAIAIAGGASDSSVDSIVTLNRKDTTASQPLSAIDPGSADDVLLLPQDRLAVAFRPRTFTVLGASGKPAEIPFQNLRVSLAEAVGRAGGPSDAQADPSAVYVFRYEPANYDGSPAEGARPVAYRLNLGDPHNYFLAQRFEMRPRDVVYVANAGSNIPTKAIQILNLFFSPFYTAKVLTQ